MIQDVLRTLETLLNPIDNPTRTAAQSHLLSLATSPQFLPFLSSIIVTLVHPQHLRLLATLTLQKAVLTINSDSPALITSLLQLIKHPLPIQMRGVIADSINSLVNRSGQDPDIRRSIYNYLTMQISSLLQKDMDVGQVQYLVILLQVLSQREDEITNILLDGTLPNLIQIAIRLVQSGAESETAIGCLKLTTQLIQNVFEQQDLINRPLLKKLLLFPKFQTLISLILLMFSQKSLLKINPNNQYGPLERSANQCKCNSLSILTSSMFYLSQLISEKDSSIAPSPLIPKMVYYLERCLYTLQTLSANVAHFMQLDYTSMGRGVDQMLKYCMIFVHDTQFYGFFSNATDNFFQVISGILTFTQQQKAKVSDSPEEFVELVKSVMEAGNKHHLYQFYVKNKQEQFSTKVLAGRLLIEILNNIDGSLVSIFKQTAIKTLSDTSNIPIPTILKSYTLLGVVCNCVQNRKDLKACVQQFIQNEIELIYASHQPTLDHKVYQCMRFVFILLYHRMFFNPDPEENGFCQELFQLVEQIFQGDFQLANQNQALVICSYDILRSLLQLDSTYISQYTQSLLSYFLKQLKTDNKPSSHFLKSFQQLCHQNECLEASTNSLLECVTALVRHVHAEVKSEGPNENIISQMIQIIDKISRIHPATMKSEWKLYFEQNMFSLAEHFGSDSVEIDKIVKIVVRLVKQFKEINQYQLNLISYGVNYVNTHNKIGIYYDLIQLSMVYGQQYYRQSPELVARVVEIASAVLNKDLILEAQILKGLVVITCLCQLSKPVEGASQMTPQLWEHIQSLLAALSVKYARQELIKSNIIAAFAVLYSCGLIMDSQIVSRILSISESSTHSVLACKILVMSFCDIIKHKQVQIPQFFKCALVQVVYICSKEARIFVLNEEDDDNYEIEKGIFTSQTIYSNINWLETFNQTFKLLQTNPQIYKAVLNILDKVDRQRLQIISTLKITPYGIREIRKLRRGM